MQLAASVTGDADGDGDADGGDLACTRSAASNRARCSSMYRCSSGRVSLSIRKGLLDCASSWSPSPARARLPLRMALIGCGVLKGCASGHGAALSLLMTFAPVGRLPTGSHDRPMDVATLIGILSSLSPGDDADRFNSFGLRVVPISSSIRMVPSSIQIHPRSRANPFARIPSSSRSNLGSSCSFKRVTRRMQTQAAISSTPKSTTNVMPSARSRASLV